MDDSLDQYSAIKRYAFPITFFQTPDTFLFLRFANSAQVGRGLRGGTAGHKNTGWVMGLESMVSVPGLLLPAVQHWPHATVQPQEATP